MIRPPAYKQSGTIRHPAYKYYTYMKSIRHPAYNINLEQSGTPHANILTIKITVANGHTVAITISLCQDRFVAVLWRPT